MIHEYADKLAKTCWEMLADGAVAELSLADIAAACEMSEAEAMLYGGDVTSLIIRHLDALDKQALIMSAADFGDDPHASIYEKLLEGLMMRFEALAEHRVQFLALHEGAKKNPVMGAHLLHQLSDSIGKLVMIAGDDSTGFIKQTRILGIVGVLLRVRPVWQKDEGHDLGLTMKALDEELKKACEWAVSLRVLSRHDVAGGDVAGDNSGDDS